MHYLNFIEYHDIKREYLVIGLVDSIQAAMLLTEVYLEDWMQDFRNNTCLHKKPEKPVQGFREAYILKQQDATFKINTVAMCFLYKGQVINKRSWIVCYSIC